MTTMATRTRNRGIEIGRGNEMASLLAEAERTETEELVKSREPEEYWATPAFLVPSVAVRAPWRRRRG
jgi:hypothetical protein